MREMTDLTLVKAFAFDVDGVFTDGGILCDLHGELYRTFDAKDGFSIRMATMQGYPCAIITGGRSASITARFQTCGIGPHDVYLGSRDKIADFESFCAKYNLKHNEVLYMGDDIPDIPVLEICGVAACPSDAVEEVKAVSHLISSRPGGKGSVREVIEKIMKLQGNWNFDVGNYKQKF